MSGKLYTDGPQKDVKAPILITHFEGAMDAGSAGTLAVVHLLRNLSPTRVATFDRDRLIDYRSHRPLMVVQDWVTQDIVTPEIALDLVHDDSGTPFLILHGPEPDNRWDGFTSDVADLVKNAGVELVVSLHGFPAAVPHTRPVLVHRQSDDPDLIPDQSAMPGTWRFPAPLSEYLQYQLTQDRLKGVTLYGAVPYYMADSAYPRAASALVRHLASMADLSLPIGDLERGADEDAEQVEHLVGQNEEVQRTIGALEQHYDAIIRGEKTPFGPQVIFLEGDHGARGDEDERNGDDSEDLGTGYPAMGLIPEDLEGPVADLMGDAIEQYLRSQPDSRGAAESGISTGREPSDTPPPRHRAPHPWERAEGEDLEDSQGSGGGENRES